MTRQTSIYLPMVLAITALFASSVQAQTEYEYVKPKNSLSYKSKKKARKKFGVNLFVYNNFVDSLSTTKNSNYNKYGYSSSLNARPIASYTGEYQMESAIGLGAEYAKSSLLKAGPVRFGFAAGTGFEFDRTVSRDLVRSFNTTSTTSQVNDNAGNPSFNLILPYVNATVKYGRSYGFTGVNYSVVQFSNAGNEEYSGKVGYQIGFGTIINRWVSLEATYRMVSFEASPNFDDLLQTNRYYNINNINVEDRAGLGVLETETLEMQGFTLSLRVSI